jgi:hypothetical protein
VFAMFADIVLIFLLVLLYMVFYGQEGPICISSIIAIPSFYCYNYPIRYR